MKKLSAGSITLAVILSVVSIMLTYGSSHANDLLDPSSALRQTSGMDASPAMFRALDKVTIEEHAGITPMTDGQLASIEGEGGGLRINIAVVVANNIAVLSSDLIQAINVAIGQSN